MGKVKYHIRRYKERAFDEKRFQEAFQYVLEHEDNLDSFARISFDNLKTSILRNVGRSEMTSKKHYQRAVLRHEKNNH